MNKEEKIKLILKEMNKDVEKLEEYIKEIKSNNLQIAQQIVDGESKDEEEYPNTSVKCPNCKNNNFFYLSKVFANGDKELVCTNCTYGIRLKGE